MLGSRRVKCRRLIRWLCIASLSGAIAATGGVIALFLIPLPATLRTPTQLTPLTSHYVDYHGALIAELPGDDARSHRPIPLSAMGPWVADFTIALEDQRFHHHPGIDPIATARALWQRRGGASTLTQQAIKVLTKAHRRTLGTKAKEALLALQWEAQSSKTEILQTYLNHVPYGNRLIGIEAAANAYFAKPAAALTMGEALYLVGIPRAPTRLNPWQHTAAAAHEFEKTCHRLIAAGVIDAAPPLPEVQRNLPQNAAPHFIQQIASELASEAQKKHTQHRGRIPTTLDLSLQQRTAQWVREHLDLLRRGDITQAAVVVIENESGAIRAMVGSRDFATSEINGALLFRNAGSTLKPFVYAAGIDRRLFTAATLFPDTPDAARDAYRDYDPHNFVQAHLGPVRLREALGNSLNVPAIVAVRRLGARQAFDAVADWGITFDRPLEKAGAGFILGNVGVRLVDLTSAFAGLARGGVAGPARSLPDALFPLRRIISSETAQIITDILCDNTARLQSFGAHSALAFPVRIAAKTGTSAHFCDTWTVGFTREHTVGVWIGNFNGRPMAHAASVVSAAPLWRRVIEALLTTDHPVPPSAMARTSVCALTGLLPAAHSPATVAELFLPGTAPTTDAKAWFAPDGTPLLPTEYARWCASQDNHLGARLATTPDQLEIVFPRAEATFILDPHLPPAQQQIEFQATPADHLTWTLNGLPLKPPAPDTANATKATAATGRLLWPLQEGVWELEADNGTTRATRRFTVQKE